MDKINFQNTGVVQSKPDYRDYPYNVGTAEATAPEVMPAQYETDISMLPILMQAQTPSCVSHAIVNCMKLYWYKKTGKLIDFSPRFLHVYTYASSGQPLTGGRDPRAVMLAATNIGCCTEALLPNDTSLDLATYTQVAITQAMLDEAKQWRIPGFAVVPKDDYSIQHAIYHYGMVAICASVGNEYWTTASGVASWAKADIDPLRAPKPVLSGHETALFGWQGTSILWQLLNEWSAEWADGGKNQYPDAVLKTYTTQILVIDDAAVDFHPISQNLPAPGTFTHHFATTLRYGARGDEVTALQTALMMDSDLHIDPSIALGIFANMTLQAVKVFQAKHGLTADGVVGPITNGVLNSLFDKSTG